MSWISAIPIVGDFVDSVGAAIDKNVTTDHERLQVKAEVVALTAPVLQAVLSAQAKFDEMRVQLQIVETQSGDRLVRWTRPLMSWATFLLWGYAFVMNHPMADEAFIAFTLIAGITSATRGIEKTVGKWANGKNGNGKH